MQCGAWRLGRGGRMGARELLKAQTDVTSACARSAEWRVVDASGFPTTPSANICAATMMVAEKGVDMLLPAGR